MLSRIVSIVLLLTLFSSTSLSAAGAFAGTSMAESVLPVAEMLSPTTVSIPVETSFIAAQQVTSTVPLTSTVRLTSTLPLTTTLPLTMALEQPTLYPVTAWPAVDEATLATLLPMDAQLSHKVYLPLVNQEVANGDAAWLWPWFGTSSSSFDYSLKIEKRDFDAGGGGTQANLILLPRLIELLDLLSLSKQSAEKLWGLQNTQLDDVQSLSSGSDVVVAVLDTGISLLTFELYLRTAAGYDFVGNDRFPYESRNFRDDDDDGDVDEGLGHGTFVSSLIVAATRRTRIMPIRVLNSDGAGTPEDVADGIRYAVNHGADIINLSLSSDTDNTDVRNAVEYAAANGVVVVAAALSSDTQLGFPASYNPVISVGAIDKFNTIPDFAQQNAIEIEVFAPGVNIYGPSYSGRDVWMTGNSMATAFVSAIAALLMENKSCDAICVRHALSAGTKPVVPSQGTRGAVNAYDALRIELQLP